MRITPCAECHGQRLKKSSLAVTVCDKNIYEMTDMSVKDLVKFLDAMELTQQQHLIGDQILKEIRSRVGFLQEVGLEYLMSAAESIQTSGEPVDLTAAYYTGDVDNDEAITSSDLYAVMQYLAWKGSG